MSKYFEPSSTLGAEAECAFCACLWTDPVEIAGCRHIMCRACVAKVKRCPLCNHEISNVAPPNSAIIRMLMRVRGGCSQCAWTGTFKAFLESHKTCLGSSESPAPSTMSAVEERREVERMQDYYMDGTTGREAGHSGGAAASAVQRLSGAELVRWKAAWGGMASCYSIAPSEFASLVDGFCEFTVRDGSSGSPVLRWRDACRLLRYYNYPNHPDDVQNLFDSSCQSRSDGAVSFSGLCAWIAVNQRDPVQWYGMNAEAYARVLSVAHLLDVAKNGLFTTEHAQLFAEEYFQRDVDPEESSMIVRILREQDASLRQAFQSSGNTSTLNRDFASPAWELKLPLHDILLAFRKHVEVLKRRARESQVHANRLHYAERIRNMVRFYEPAALANIEVSLARFIGEEENLLSTLVVMYGPEPSMNALQAPQ